MSAAGAGSGEEKTQKIWQVPIYSKAPEDGIITYLQDETTLKTAKVNKTENGKNTPIPVDGYFSFSYYNHDKIKGQNWGDKGTSIYIWGLYVYMKLLEKEPFQTWKILIYTDEYTYDKLKRVAQQSTPDSERIQALLTSTKVVFAIVTWDRHMRSEKKINGGALRMFRSRAPFDFPDKTIFMRDADTFFDEYVGRLQFPARFGGQVEGYLNLIIDVLCDWEKGLLANLLFLKDSYKKPLLVVGTGNNMQFGMEMTSGPALYKKNYHDNELTGRKFPFGIFAGMVSVLPGVPIYQTMDAWDECIEYLNARSVKKEQVTENNITFYKFSNNRTAQAMGRDEQIYLTILMRKSIENLFIYHIDLGDITIPTKESIDLPFHTARLADYKGALGLSGGGYRRKTYRRKRAKRSTRKH